MHQIQVYTEDKNWVTVMDERGLNYVFHDRPTVDLFLEKHPVIKTKRYRVIGVPVSRKN